MISGSFWLSLLLKFSISIGGLLVLLGLIFLIAHLLSDKGKQGGEP